MLTNPRISANLLAKPTRNEPLGLGGPWGGYPLGRSPPRGCIPLPKGVPMGPGIHDLQLTRAAHS